MWQKVNPSAEVYYWDNFIPRAQADKLFEHLIDELAWRRDSISMFGREVLIPREQAWYGKHAYTYSGLTLPPSPMPSSLHWLSDKVAMACNCSFNAVLANLYRNGQDSMGWHSDDEKELGVDPLIASVSLGEARRFQFKHKQSGDKFELELGHGSLLFMGSQTQINWAHQVPKTRRKIGQRINLTYRDLLITA